ncbi:M10 family metallopeptidase C-terminal domain-containing protein [Okeania sp.]|uniref:M10 family metallopeptidase C-terminal domain-containing protein n=1 Tax=Okeania sp. TaxID=3100323 RepID=UPI0035C8E307
MGKNGDDTLLGGKGKDKLNGGKGEDILTGGKGRDSFILANFNKTETDEITDFILGKDKLILDKSAF